MANQIASDDYDVSHWPANNRMLLANVDDAKSTEPASKRAGIESPFVPEFLGPFSLLLLLLLKQRGKHAMNIYINPNPKF